MNDPDDDRPLGVPVMTPRFKGDSSVQEEPPTTHAESDATYLGRHPDDEVGLVKQLPSGTHESTAQEKAAVETGEALATRKLYDQAVQDRLGHFQQWGRLADRTLVLALLALTALCSLFVFSQTVQILAAIAAQAAVLKWLSYTGLAVIFAILAAFSIRLLFVLLRLRVNQQVSAAQLRDLSSRAELRALVEQDKALAKKNLEDYLRKYPYEQMCIPVTPGAFRFDKESVFRLQSARDYLLDQELFSDYDGWLNNFRSRFQDHLEQVANQIVLDWTKVVGIKTAISRSSLLDSVIVLYCSYGMVGDLCRLYNLRMTGPGIARLLAFTLFNTYAAGQIEEHADAITGAVSDIGSATAEAVAPGISEKIATSLPHLFSAVPYVGAVLKTVVEPVGDGVANAFLMRKLGRTTVALLRPINPR